MGPRLLALMLAKVQSDAPEAAGSLHAVRPYGAVAPRLQSAGVNVRETG
jgi:hypothetical protein